LGVTDSPLCWLGLEAPVQATDVAVEVIEVLQGRLTLGRRFGSQGGD